MQSRGFWGQFRTGLRSYASSIRFLRQHRIRHAYVVVLGGAVATMKLVSWVLDHATERLEAIALGGIGQRWFHFENETINEVSNGLLEGLNIGLEGLIFLLKIWVQFKITKFVVLFFLSPIFALYAELIAKKSGVQRHTDRGMMWSMWRGIRSAGLLVLLELVISTILFLMLGVLPMAVPAMALLAWGILPVFSAAISVWFYGAALLDLSWDLKGLGVWNALLGSIHHSGVVLAVGLPFYLAMAVPFLGWLTGPVFGGLLGSVAAVLCMHKPSAFEGPLRI